MEDAQVRAPGRRPRADPSGRESSAYPGGGESSAHPIGRGPSVSQAGPWPVLSAVVCALLFAGLATTLALRHGAPLPGDAVAHTWGVAHRPPEAVALARGITATGTGPWPYVLVVIAGVIAGRTAGERLRAAIGALVVLVAGQLVRTGLMEIFARARPAPADWATHASGFAFPSGHATTSALTAGLLCWAVTRRARADLARTTCTLAVIWAAAVGVTRVYLGVHWASDVIGGWLLAAAWLSLWWWGLARWLPVESAGPGGPEAPGPGTAPDASHPALPSEASGGSPPSDSSGPPSSSATPGPPPSSGTVAPTPARPRSALARVLDHPRPFPPHEPLPPPHVRPTPDRAPPARPTHTRPRAA
ncbi:phosphatase PAP2 family protein [Streptomyces guryensis]|uniref:Phosphatase PAP2 family protein n=1 Tax=Streptomyces guryensis TaxID=2886947 RepID=A0A9Q3VT05_9ACTN|nr:phosphatase PAP2 family protein [Streptomyces guryensis]MCD9877099.1 phosphatase PAP2 family protein [Streptomyces guryensis]